MVGSNEKLSQILQLGRIKEQKNKLLMVLKIWVRQLQISFGIKIKMFFSLKIIDNNYSDGNGDNNSQHNENGKMVLFWIKGPPLSCLWRHLVVKLQTARTRQLETCPFTVIF